ncbi:hypothetical protein [Paenibacillus macerans]|uniref:hypothetical protein n=1 Tax=Paenibacillus macerans TaxID=44252 RepID=UPI002040DFF0|nr:hypothetical protein [Paenibacillus macerans]MCM3699229.1 hypothetical protein [Paenibacillus macerans]
MNDEFGRPLLQSMMGDRIWRLMRADREAFMRETRDYFALGYPGWTVIRVKYPIVYLRDDREA